MRQANSEIRRKEEWTDLSLVCVILPFELNEIIVVKVIQMESSRQLLAFVIFSFWNFYFPSNGECKHCITPEIVHNTESMRSFAKCWRIKKGKRKRQSEAKQRKSFWTCCIYSAYFLLLEFQFQGFCIEFVIIVYGIGCVSSSLLLIGARMITSAFT